jgi:hypothetical protein
MKPAHGAPVIQYGKAIESSGRARIPDLILVMLHGRFPAVLKREQ